MKDFFCRLVEMYFESTFALIKIRAAGYYVKAVGAAREVFIINVAFKCALLLMLAGFVLVHVAIFMFLPWSPETKAVVLLILGSFYFLISLFCLLKLCSQKFWMNYSKASDLVKDVTGKN